MAKTICLKFTVQRGHSNKMVIQFVFSKQIAEFNIQMKDNCSIGQRSSWSSLVACIPSKKKLLCFLNLGCSHSEKHTLRKQQTDSPKYGELHCFQIRNSPPSLKQRKSSAFPTVSQMNHFPPRRDLLYFPRWTHSLQHFEGPALSVLFLQKDIETKPQVPAGRLVSLSSLCCLPNWFGRTRLSAATSWKALF